MAIIKINGNPLTPEPETFAWTEQDEDSASTGRNQKGDLVRDVVAKKRKLLITYGPLTQGQMAAILQAIDGPSVEVEAPDAKAGTMATGTFYAGVKTAHEIIHRPTGWLWRGLEVNLIEL